VHQIIELKLLLSYRCPVKFEIIWGYVAWFAECGGFILLSMTANGLFSTIDQKSDQIRNIGGRNSTLSVVRYRLDWLLSVRRAGMEEGRSKLFPCKIEMSTLVCLVVFVVGLVWEEVFVWLHACIWVLSIWHTGPYCHVCPNLDVPVVPHERRCTTWLVEEGLDQLITFCPPTIAPSSQPFHTWEDKSVSRVLCVCVPILRKAWTVRLWKAGCHMDSWGK
jgi:hypothetical protein